MSTIASGMNQERQNRWLLIGAAVLAVAAGVLIFMLLTNTGGGDGGVSGAIEDGDVKVLVAAQTIDANTRITEEMLVERSVSDEGAVSGYVGETSAVVGRVTTSPIVEGQQVSYAQIAGTETESIVENGLSPALDLGRVAFSMSANEVSNVAGFVQAGDYVNVMAVYAIDDSLDSVPGGAVGINDRPYTRVETLLQNVEVLAVAQVPVDAVPAADISSTGTEGDAAANVTGAEEDTGSDRQRPDEVEPNPGATTVTVHLSVDEAQVLAGARAEGELFLALRALGDTGTAPVDVLCFDKFGRFPCPPVAR